MDAAASTVRPSSSQRLLEHCLALELVRRRPTARARLDELLGAELAQRLVLALSARSA